MITSKYLCVPALIVTALLLAGCTSKMQNPQGVAPQPSGTDTPSPYALDTSDWKSYTNKASKYSFKYPKNWRLVDNTNGKVDGSVQVFNYGATKYVGGEPMKSGDIKIEMAVLGNESKRSLNDFVSEVTSHGLNENDRHIFTPTTLGNVPAISDHVVNDSSYMSYYVSLTDTSVLVLTTAPQTDSPEVTGILSSFTK